MSFSRARNHLRRAWPALVRRVRRCHQCHTSRARCQCAEPALPMASTSRKDAPRIATPLSLSPFTTEWLQDSTHGRTRRATHRRQPQPAAAVRPGLSITPRVAPTRYVSIPLTPARCAAVLATIGDTLSHIRYAVCGGAAMAAWGRPVAEACGPRGGRAPPVCIVCPSSTVEVLTSWAASKSLTLCHTGGSSSTKTPNVIGMPVSNSAGGGICPVGIRWVDDDCFAQLRVRPARRAAATTVSDGPDPRQPRILALDALVDLAAHDYAHSTEAVAVPAVRDTLARDLHWLLRRLARDRGAGHRGLTPAGAPAVLDPLFCDVFPRAYPEAERLFAAAGLALPSSSSSGSTARKPLPGLPRKQACAQSHHASSGDLSRVLTLREFRRRTVSLTVDHLGDAMYP